DEQPSVRPFAANKGERLECDLEAVPLVLVPAEQKRQRTITVVCRNEVLRVNGVVQHLPWSLPLSVEPVRRQLAERALEEHVVGFVQQPGARLVHERPALAVPPRIRGAVLVPRERGIALSRELDELRRVERERRRPEIE